VSRSLEIEIWSDVVCPWCYIGKRRLERALSQFEHADQVAVRWRSFQLDPGAPRFDPRVPPAGHVDYLTSKFGAGPEQVLAMIRQVSQVAAGEGLDYDLEHGLGARNTADAHRLLHAARDAGGPALQGAVAERIMLAYFTERADTADPEVLANLAAEAGLPAARARQVLAGREYAEQVDADQAQARALGARGVPFFVLDRQVGISGAQPVEVFSQALQQAWAGAAVD
jgi:predicted DsbA family dithiol-disulfide isomerase